jgi:hypothetical protein
LGKAKPIESTIHSSEKSNSPRRLKCFQVAADPYDPEHDLLRRQWAKEFGWEISLLHKEGDEAVDIITVELYQLTFASMNF